jgi:hypothetical protein
MSACSANRGLIDALPPFSVRVCRIGEERTTARRTTIGILAAGVVGLAGCGGGTQFANQPRPPTPIDLSVYIDDAKVSVSPHSVGAGPVVFIVTNQASKTESLTIAPAGRATQPLATTGPISPQATAQVSVDLSSPGNYTVAAGGSVTPGKTEAALATQQAPLPSSIQSASLHIGPKRPNGSNALLQP